MGFSSFPGIARYAVHVPVIAFPGSARFAIALPFAFRVIDSCLTFRPNVSRTMNITGNASGVVMSAFLTMSLKEAFSPVL